MYHCVSLCVSVCSELLFHALAEETFPVCTANSTEESASLQVDMQIDCISGPNHADLVCYVA